MNLRRKQSVNHRFRGLKEGRYGAGLQPSAQEAEAGEKDGLKGKREQEKLLTERRIESVKSEQEQNP